ncbi:MAG: serine/threonine-protein phosphatase [Kofleriaceae bacterium]|nr:serine/threonine-protein phosphatase [Kofleriaceae bacterium]
MQTETPPTAPASPHQAESETEVRISWLISFLLLAPGLGIILTGLVVGLSSIFGIMMVVSGVSYLVIEALYIQPQFAFKMPGLELEHVALEFSIQRAKCKSVSELATNLQGTLKEGLGIDDLILILQGDEGQMTFGGCVADLTAIRDAPRALGYLEQHKRVVIRDDLAGLTDTAARAALDLLDVLEADLFLPFRQDDHLLGFAILDRPRKNSDYAKTFLEIVSENMSSGLIILHLKRQAGGQEAMTQTFALAQAMQNSLLPKTELVKIESVELQGWCDPAEQCGGDVWAWHNLGDGKILLFVGDATGHGVSPATLAASVSGALAAYARVQGQALEPAALLSDLNSMVRKVGRSHHMMTAFACVVDNRRGEIVFANAGHNPPLIWRQKEEGGAFVVLKVPGSMLGSADVLNVKQSTAKLHHNDMVYLFSDGIIEAGEPYLPQLGNREFRKTLRECADLSVSDACNHMKQRVLTHLGDMDAGDDMTFLVMRYTGGAL